MKKITLYFLNCLFSEQKHTQMGNGESSGGGGGGGGNGCRSGSSGSGGSCRSSFSASSYASSGFSSGSCSGPSCSFSNSDRAFSSGGFSDRNRIADRYGGIVSAMSGNGLPSGPITGLGGVGISSSSGSKSGCSTGFSSSIASFSDGRSSNTGGIVAAQVCDVKTGETRTIDMPATLAVRDVIATEHRETVEKHDTVASVAEIASMATGVVIEHTIPGPVSSAIATSLELATGAAIELTRPEAPKPVTVYEK